MNYIAAFSRTTMGTRRQRIRQVWTRFFLYSFGVFLVYSAYGTLLSLQSSINVEDGLGTIGLATIYGSAVVFSVLGAPAILRKYEAKKCVCCSEITYIVYTVANFYPSFYTIIPASVVVGIGDCLLWSCFPIMNTFFANLHSPASDKGIQHSFEAKFSGYFFAIFQMAKISGNLISYAILYGFNESELDINSTSTPKNWTLNSSTPLDYTHCGARDCLDEVTLDHTISQYVPTNDWALYVLVIVMTLLCVGAVIIHFACIPSTEEFLATRRKRGSANLAGTGIKQQKSLLTKQHSVEENLNTIIEKPSEKGEDKNGNLKMLDNADESNVSFAITTAKDVVLQLFEPRQWLLLPMSVYAGLGFGFLTSEVTRSYSSCVFGVSWVPIHALFFGVGAAAMCYATGKLSKLLSRNVFVTFGAVCDVSLYLYCRFWTPQATSHFSLIPIYFVLGGTIGGVWIPISQVLQVITFPDRLDVSSPIWNFWFMGGIGAQFAWSSHMCVDTKIYIQLGVLAISLLGYGIAERLRIQRISQNGKGVFNEDKV